MQLVTKTIFDYTILTLRVYTGTLQKTYTLQKGVWGRLLLGKLINKELLDHTHNYNHKGK